METLKDVWASLIAHIHERTSNPLTFAFLVSWIGWNYKFVVYLLDNDTAANRLNSIQAMYPLDWSTYRGSAFGYPLLTACFFVFVWPFITEQVVKFYRWRQIKIANTLKVIEAERVITQKQATEMVRRHEAERQKDAEEVARLDAAVESLRSALTAAEAEVAKVKPPAKPETAPLSPLDVLENQDPDAGLDFALPNTREQESTGRLDQTEASLVNVLKTPQQVAILQVMSEAPNPQSVESISNATKMNFTIAKVHLEELQKLKLVVANQTVRGERWVLTAQGQRFVVDRRIAS